MRVLKKCNLKIMVYVGIVGLLSAAGLIVLAGSIKTRASARPSYKYYTNVEIQPGDTLWKFADIYMTSDYKNRKEYIEEICRLNHIAQEDNIYAGQYITIPYYSHTYLK